MQNQQWTKVTGSVWVRGEWAVEDCNGYADLFRNGEFVRDFKTADQAKRGANPKTLDQVAAWREADRLKAPGLAKLPVKGATR
jgi:hypothetical protein